MGGLGVGGLMGWVVFRWARGGWFQGVGGLLGV